MLKVAEEFHGSHTGRQRRANEDSLYARTPLFAVADGMGGAQAGEIASSVAVETLGAAGVPEGAAEQRLAEIVQEANDRIHALSREDQSRAGMGTTMTVLLVGTDDVTIAHVGDSRAYRLRGGQLERLTDDHSLVEEYRRLGRLTDEEAENHPQRSIITRALGPEAHVEVDTHTWPARAGDVFLVCSDGLTTMIKEG
ncbi:MAG TPA: protein phosphatase 2C domain-containing protein, partial [Solirubrobacteraceae bacterium]|nr:protein phosphatase 2C domain-containing protein [Solirubrobacteraceae bacterium]